jgi:mannose/cellobiose epimerase-like protein (N-acyl-D-glucosamine 2-epimerase family)
VARLPSGERWQEHLRKELLPFWSMPEALGEQVGAFPSVRCNDGTLLDRADPCPEIRGNEWLMEDRTYVVALSRQAYAYGVAFHLTGEPRYLELALAGVEYLRRNAFDPKHGGAYAWRDGATGQWGPEVAERNPQEQAYALLGPGLYYYLTRNEEVLQDIESIKDSIFRSHGPLQAGPLRQKPGAQGPGRLVDSLDQLNAYLVLLTPLLPPEKRDAWAQDMKGLTHQLIERYYSPEENLFFMDALPPQERRLGRSNSDFGHTIKSLWMIRMVGQATGEAGLVRFAEEQGRRVLARAYLPDTGSWASSVRPDGTLETNKEWWMYTELDQFAASLALTDPSVGAPLPRTQDYWLRHFVDPVHGEVWTTLDGTTHQPLTAMPKQWPWKNGFHSFEHALVGYITAQQLRGEPVVLYYAFDPREPGQAVRPYFFTGSVEKVEALGPSIYRVTFRSIG